MSGHVHELTLLCAPAAVDAGSRWVRGLAQAFGLSHEEVFRLDLCANELLANVVSYAYEGAGPHSIDLRLTLDETASVLEVRDHGKPFDPLALPPPEQSTDLAHAAIGGHGVHLVRSFADACEYRRDGNQNVLTVTLNHSALVPGDRTPRGTDRRRPGPGTPPPWVRSDGTEVREDQRRGMDRRLLGFISSFAIFREVPYWQVEDLVASCPLREFADGEVLLRPGERNFHVALVVRGKLQVHLDSPDSPDFLEVAVGECVGEMSIIDGQPVSAFVVGDAGCQLLLIEASRFLDELLAVPRVARNLMSVLAERMRRGNARELARLRAAMELERLQREMRFAHDIQVSMLPGRSPLFPERADVDCDGLMRATREVGGDFYEAFFVEPQRLFFAIGDVCGKGMPAALFMVRTLTLLRAEAPRRAAHQSQHIQRVVERFNRLLCAGNETGLFTSVFCGLLDTSSGLLSFVNAGHNPPLLAQAGGGFDFVAEPRNLIAGIMEGAGFEAGELRLEPGSVLMLYTDGVTEAENAAGAMFGDAQLLKLLNGARERSASGLIGATLEAVDAFAGGHPQSDDITMLALRYLGDRARR